MKIHQLDVAEAIASLHTSADGLPFEAAQHRLREYGLNRVEGPAQAPVVLRFMRELTRFFSLVLWAAAVIALLMEHMMPGQGMAKLALVIVGVIVISGLFSFWQEFRAERALAALRRLLPQQVEVLRQGKATLLSAETLVPGDVVVLEAGSRVPADCRLIEAFGLRVNNATVTGESMSVACSVEPSSAEELSQANNVLLAGTDLVAGHAKAVVFATGVHTEFGTIVQLTQGMGEEDTPLRKEIARLSRFIIALAGAIALAFFGLGWIIGVPVQQNFIVAIGIIIAMVPEGLLPTLTLALVLATQRLAKRNVLVRHLPAVETLGSATVICTDKTGTLTQNRMSIRTILLGVNEVVDSPASLQRDHPLISRYHPFFLTAALCHDLVNSEGEERSAWRGDAMEIALAELARATLDAIPDWRKIDEIPLDAARMRLSSVYQSPQGAVLYCKGAPETVLPLCEYVLMDGAIQPLQHAMRDQIAQAHERMTNRGLRVLAFAFRERDLVHARDLETELVFAGLVGLEDPPRPEVSAAIETCHRAGIKVIMVTGDHPQTALTLAREIGLVRSATPTVVVGTQLRRLSRTQLQLLLDAPEILFARVGADQKRQIVDALKQKRHIVAVTGDGVNDAPALKSAHIGIAMGVTGTDVAKAAADVVLLDDNFASIVAAVEEGRAVFDNIRKLLTYILAHNVPELLPNLILALVNLPPALTPLQILAIDMGTDSITALGLGSERAEPETMRRPPRPAQERLLNWGTASRAYLRLGLIEAAAAMATFWYVLHGMGWRYGQELTLTNPIYVQATTACLCSVVVMQVVNVFLCRSATRSTFSVGLFGNRLILLGVLFEFVVIIPIVYTPLGNMLFTTAPIEFAIWLFVLPFAAVLILADEIQKWFARGSGANRSELT